MVPAAALAEELARAGTTSRWSATIAGALSPAFRKC
jgi:hypothetical protein